MAADCGCGGTCPACKPMVDAYIDYHRDVIIGGETIEKDLKPAEVLDRHTEKLKKQKIAVITVEVMNGQEVMEKYKDDTSVEIKANTGIESFGVIPELINSRIGVKKGILFVKRPSY